MSLRYLLCYCILLLGINPSDGDDTAPETIETIERSLTTLEQSPQGSIDKPPPIPTPKSRQEESTQETSSQNKASILPWVLAISMSVIAGICVGYIIFTSQREKHYLQIRKQVIDGTEPVPLIDEEARILLQELKGTAEQQIANVQNLVEGSSEQQQIVHNSTTESVKKSQEILKENLGKISNFLTTIAKSAQENRSDSRDTRDLVKQLASSIPEKDREISKLQEGFHVQLIGPLVNAFLDIRDHLYIEKTKQDHTFHEFITSWDQSILSALNQLGISEISVPENPEDLAVRFWESTGAGILSDDSNREGYLAKIHRIGYQLSNSRANEIVIRKALISRFFTPSEAGQQEVKSN